MGGNSPMRLRDNKSKPKIFSNINKNRTFSLYNEFFASASISTPNKDKKQLILTPKDTINV